MNELDVWTVSLMIRTDDTRTRADAFLQGPSVEVACSAEAEPHSRVAGAAPAGGGDVAAARALEELAGRLIERAADSVPTVTKNAGEQGGTAYDRHSSREHRPG
jgi:hypothetical protein